MNKMSKIGFSRAVLLILFFLAAANPCLAEEEAPLTPMTVQGVVLIDGSPAPVDTVIAAYLGGEYVEQFLVIDPSGSFAFYISGKAGDEGKPVTFTVDGKDSGESFGWESGKEVLSAELSLNMESGSGSSRGISISNSGPESLTETAEPEVSEAETIADPASQPDVTVSENTNQENTTQENTVADFGVEQNAKSSDDSSEPESTPGFYVIYGVAGIILLTFGSKMGKESRRKP